MSVTYRIDTKNRAIYTRCVGMVTFPEVLQHFRELKNDPECVGDFDVLLDVSAMESIPKGAQIRAVTHEVKFVQDKVRFAFCAVVAVTDPLFGMLRMFEAMAGPYFREIHVFRGAEEAQAWLEMRREQWMRFGCGPGHPATE